MKKQEFTRQEVVEVINELLQRPDVLNDAVNNENTNYDAEALLDLVSVERQLNFNQMFDVNRNDDAKRFEFNSKGDWVSYTIHFNECQEDVNNAWISIYKALQKDLELYPNNYLNAPISTTPHS